MGEWVKVIMDRQSFSVNSFISILIYFLLMPYSACAENKQAFQFTKKPEIQQVRPKKPVKIKLHRTANGEYTWDLTGDSVDEIARANSRLKKLLKLE